MDTICSLNQESFPLIYQAAFIPKNSTEFLCNKSHPISSELLSSIRAITGTHVHLQIGQ